MSNTCGHCICYLTDEDEHGNLAEFHHDNNKETGFCSIRDLFHIVKQNTPACKDFIDDGEGYEGTQKI